MRRTLIPLTLLSLALFGCNREPADLAPDELPQVAIASINGIDGRNTPFGTFYVPASTLVDPVTGQTQPYPVVVKVTASDETRIEKVDLYLDGTLIKSLDPVDDEEEFNNPFTFVVPFVGTASGLRDAEIKIVAVDNKGQENKPFIVDVKVDGSIPVLDFDQPTEPLKGSVIFSGSMYDLESPLTDFIAYIDDDKANDLTVTVDETVKISSFATVVDTGSLGEGQHIVTFEAQNGANVRVKKSFRFEVVEDDPVTP
jgi:Bacterial Ig domain